MLYNLGIRSDTHILSWGELVIFLSEKRFLGKSAHKKQIYKLSKIYVFNTPYHETHMAMPMLFSLCLVLLHSIGTTIHLQKYLFFRILPNNFSIISYYSALLPMFVRRYSIVTPYQLHIKSIVSMEYLWMNDGEEMEFLPLYFNVSSTN